MEHTEIVFEDDGYGEIRLFSDKVQAGEMVISKAVDRLTVYHTEVYPQFEGKGFAKLLLDSLVNYSKESGLKIVPLCPYVNAQFHRHPAEYADVWFKEKSL